MSNAIVVHVWPLDEVLTLSDFSQKHSTCHSNISTHQLLFLKICNTEYKRIDHFYEHIQIVTLQRLMCIVTITADFGIRPLELRT